MAYGYTKADLRAAMEVARHEAVLDGKGLRSFRVNGMDSTLPRIITPPVQADTPEAAILWLRQHTIFKPHSPLALLQSLQVLHNKQWVWFVAR